MAVLHARNDACVWRLSSGATSSCINNPRLHILIALEFCFVVALKQSTLESDVLYVRLCGTMADVQLPFSEVSQRMHDGYIHPGGVAQVLPSGE
jgi:hypothetical protein